MMSINKKWFFLAVLLLQGCTADFNKKYTEKDLQQSSPGLQSMEEQKQKAYTRYDTAFLGKTVAYSAKQQQLLAQHVEFISDIPVSLYTVLQTLSAQAKSSFLINEKAPGGDKAAQGKKPQAGTEPAASVIALHQVNFSGTVEELLNYLSQLYDVTVRLTDDNIIQASVYHTYAIKLDFFGKENAYESSLDLSEGGGMKGKSETKFKSTFWDDVRGIVEKYVSSGVYNVFEDVGVLTFSGRPSEYRVLAAVLKDFKQDNSKQFIITYKVFTLDKNKERNLGAELGLNFAEGGTVFNLNSGAVSTPAAAGPVFFERLFNSSKGTGVAAKLDALYRLAGKKVLQSGTMVTRNNTPAPLNLTVSENYVSGVTRTISGQGGEFSSAITTDTITSGTSVIMTPRLLSDGRIQLTSAFTKKSHTIIDFAASADQKIQLPNVHTTELFNTVDVTPGSLIVVGRYELEDNADDNQAQFVAGKLNRSQASSTVVMVVGVDYYSKPFQEGQ